MTDHLAIMDSAVPSLSLERAARSYHEERIPLSPPLPDRDMRWRWAVAILAAILLHIAVVTTIDDGFQREKTRDQAPVPVEIVTEQPKLPPPPEPKPEPKPVEKPPEQVKPPEPEPQHEQPLFSGGDLEGKAPGAPPLVTTPTDKPPTESSAPELPTVAPPAPITVPTLPTENTPEAVPVPPPSSARTTQEAKVPPPVPSRKPPAPVARLSSTEAPPQAENPPSPPDPGLQLGEGGGNKYLNAMRDQIRRHKFYPPTAEMFGWQGYAKFQIVIDRQGQLVSFQLLQSSGYDILDKAGLAAIRQSAPFAPIPPNLWPGVNPVGLIFIAAWPDEIR